MIRALTVLCAVLLSVTSASAEGQVGKVFSIEGSASVWRAGAETPLKDGMVILPGDEVRVGDPGRVALELSDGSFVRLPSSAKMRFPGGDDSINLVEGSMHFFSHSEKHPTVVTEHVTAAIRGTEFTVETDEKGSSVSLFSGSVDGESKYGRVALAAGQGARFNRGKPPEIYSIQQADRKVQWSLFVPFIGGEEALGDSAELKRALELARSGEPQRALKGLPLSATACAPSNVLRARMLISEGAPDEGTKLLERCVVTKEKSPAHGLAEASLALVRLQQGDTVAADNLSAHAFEEDPASVTTRIVRSLVLQQKGDLDGALAAVNSDGQSKDGNLLAREAEVRFMFGQVPEARGILEQISNRSWYAETVYGFVLMGDRSFDEAKAAFEHASAEQPGAALPRMGLGIVQFNKGELAQARQEFEKAVVLEPGRSIYRSYLGKDYFEDDNYKPAYPEYERAIELDPNDPTPYLYRSFMKVADNNLVGAIEDLDQAIELSNRRDVYRSSFLLDQDSAVQSASIGRVYNELGYRERGRVEALTSIIDDYQNASAHRLLSQTQEDIYLADTIASERRIANLFSPLSINVVDSIGTNVSLNEYSQLLEKDGWRTASNSFYDSKAETFKTGILSAHKFGNYVLGLSADGLGQDGISDDPRTSAGNVGFSFQGEPDWANRFLFEGRGTTSNQTDYVDSADVLEGNVSAAWLHRIAPGTSLILNSLYDRSRSKLHTFPNTDDQLSYRDYEVTTIFDGEAESEVIALPTDRRDNIYQTSVVNEAQVVSETDRWTHILTYRNVANTLSEQDQSQITYEFSNGSTIDIPFDSSAPSSLTGNYAAYLGDYEVVDGLHVNFGGEYDSVQFGQDPEQPPYFSNTLSQSLWSPKGGLVYKPDETIILRTGYAESLAKGTDFDLVSIMPTTVGGIIQRFNDLPGTKSQNFGVGMDFHPRKTTFFGAEWTKRWLSTLTEPTQYAFTVDFDNNQIYRSADQGDPQEGSATQNFATAYVYELLTRNLAAGLDYRFAQENIPANAGADFDANSIDHRGKMFGNYYFPNSMWFAHGAGIYRYQNFDGGVEYQNSNDAGFFFNAGVGYRLPTRHGRLRLDVNNIFGQDLNINQATYFNEPIWSDPTVVLVADFNF